MHVQPNKDSYQQYRFEKQTEITRHSLPRLFEVLIDSGFELGMKRATSSKAGKGHRQGLGMGSVKVPLPNPIDSNIVGAGPNLIQIRMPVLVDGTRRQA